MNDKIEEHMTATLNHGLNLECKVKASPEALISWFYVSRLIFGGPNLFFCFLEFNKHHEACQ